MPMVLVSAEVKGAEVLKEARGSQCIALAGRGGLPTIDRPGSDGKP